MRTLRLTDFLLFAATMSGGLPTITQAQEKSQLEIPPVVLIKNVHVWDGTSDTMKDVDVLIVGDKIRKVAKDIPTEGTVEVDAVRKTMKQVADAPGMEAGKYNFSVTNDKGKVEKVSAKVTVIDGKGGYLIPGIIDSHQHVMFTAVVTPDHINNKNTSYMVAYESLPQAKKLLMMGVTSIRDLGGPSLDLARAIDKGLVDGPRIYSSGAFIGCTSGHGDFTDATSSSAASVIGSSAWWMTETGFSYLADGPDEVSKAVRLTLSKGAPQVKIMAGGGVASLKDPLESVGYSEAEMRAAVEAAADYDTYVMAHAYNDESVKRCIKAGVKDIVHGHLLSEEVIKMMAENDVWLGSLSSPYGLMDVPFFTDENRAKGRKVLDGYENVMKLAKKHGVKIGFGTDAAAQMVDTVLYEFEMRSKFFTPLEMLKQATSTNAELLRFSNSRDPYKAAPLGVIKEGAWADMLIYDGNPLKSIDFVTKPKDHLKVIIKGGKVYKNELE